MKHETPPFVLAMAYGIINPKTGLPLAYDGEPFSSYHKKNEFKVGNNHLRCEVIQRARLDPNWVGSRRGNNDPPKSGSWSKKSAWSGYRTIPSKMKKIASVLLIL